MINILRKVFVVLFFSICLKSHSQDKRAQLPAVLNNSYFEVNMGYINYPFTARQLESGYNLQSVEIPHAAVKVVLAGYEFNKYLSAQISYLRPVMWVRYTFNAGTSDTEENRTVWMNVGGLTLRPGLPLSEKFSVYGEAGMSWITRNGFKDNSGNTVVTNANYATLLTGGGIQYHVDDRWRLNLGMVYSPANGKSNQPATSFFSAGFSYKLKPRSKEQLEETAITGYIYPAQMFMIGYSTTLFGYGVNRFLTEGKIPVFWAGNAYVRQGIAAQYIRNIYHGKRVFSFDWGAGISYWQSNITHENIYTLSLFPVFKFTLFHSKPADMYFLYSVAGPTYISNTVVDGMDLGRKFTFQDYMGIGSYFGKLRKICGELRITHYSNGNIFPSNEGLTIPLSFNVGYAF